MLALFGLTGSALLAIDQPKQVVQTSNTQRVDFPPGGTLSVKNSTGELTIEAWDQPAVEIETIKSTKEEYAPAEREKASRDLDHIHINVERKGNDLVIATEFPHSRFWPPSYPIGGTTPLGVEYHIRVPRDTKLVIEHYTGEVHVDGVTSDVNVTARQGTIVLHLPESGQYVIDAKSAMGKVMSDFPGSTKTHYFWGHEFTQTAQAPHKLFVRDRFGDIIFLKIHTPQAPL